MARFVDTTEVNHLAVDLADAPARVGHQVDQVIRKTAFDIEHDAKAIVPVDTGFLKNSISTDIEGDGGITYSAAEIGPTASYGEYVEDGTSRMSPQPYMRPAYDRRKDGLVQALEQIAGDFL